jgi:hypothetical protein
MGHLQPMAGARINGEVAPISAVPESGIAPPESTTIGMGAAGVGRDREHDRDEQRVEICNLVFRLVAV